MAAKRKKSTASKKRTTKKRTARRKLRGTASLDEHKAWQLQTQVDNDSVLYNFLKKELKKVFEKAIAKSNAKYGTRANAATKKAAANDLWEIHDMPNQFGDF